MSNLPKNIGRYEILGAIGRGGMGSLFLALDPKLDRQIAIKVLRDDDDELRERFAREARAAARLRHNNIVTIFDVGEHDGQPFIAMEYIQGQTLAEIVRGNVPLPLARKLELIEALCDGLGFAHKSGIIHRDVKPANLMLDADGSLKILDFGIARAAEASGMTQAGMLIGTLNYMSPEQVSGQPVDLRSDLFAVGAVFYEVISYRQAFPGGLTAGILNKIMSTHPDPLPSIVPDLDPQIVRIVERALEKDPARRYQDLTAMRREIATVRMRLGTDSPTIVAPFPAPVADTQPTPTPGRRPSTDLEGLARRRAEQIRTHMADAEQKLAAGDADAAIGFAEQVLLLDAHHAAAHALIDRARAAVETRQIEEAAESAARAIARGDFDAAASEIEHAAAINPQAPRVVELRRTLDEAVRRADEAKQKEALDRRAREVVAEAEDRFRGGARDEAVAVLASFHPPHPLVAQSLERLRAELARHVDAERAKADAAARESRIASGIDAARAAVASGAFGDAVNRLRALEDAEGPTTSITTALDDALTRQRDADRAAKVAAEIDAHVAEAETLLARASLQPALAKAKAALALDRNHVASKDLIGRIEAAIREAEEARKAAQAKREADARAKREREKASAEALKKARRASSPEAAIAVLTAALEHDADNADLKRELETRQAGLGQAGARAAAAEQQRAFEEAARNKGIASADDDDRTVVLRPSDAAPASAVPDPGETVALKPSVPPPAVTPAKTPAAPAAAAKAPASAPKAPDKAPPPKAAEPRLQPRAVADLPAAAPAASSAASGAGLKIGLAAAGVVVVGAIAFFTLGGGSNETTTQDPTAAPQQQAEVVAPSVPAVESNVPAAQEQVPAAVPEATTTAPAAAATPTQGRRGAPATTPGQDRQAAAIAAIVRDAQDRLAGGNVVAALEAIEGGLKLRANDPALLDLAQQARREAVSRASAARNRAVETGEAAGLAAFREGEELQQRSGAQLAADPVQSTRTMLQAVTRYDQAASQGQNIAVTRAAEAAQRPSAQVPVPPVVNAAAEEAAIRGVIDRYRDAYSRLDVDAVLRVWPNAPAADLRKSFQNFRSQEVAFSNLAINLAAGNTAATASAREQMVMQPRSGSAQKRQGNITFQLQKSGANWLIQSVAR